MGEKFDPESMANFVEGFYKNLPAENIPPPKTPFDDLVQLCVDYLREYPLLVGSGLACPILLLLAFLWLMGGEEEKPRRSKKDKKEKREANGSTKESKSSKGTPKTPKTPKSSEKKEEVKESVKGKKKRTRRKKPRRVVKISSDLALAMSRCWPRDSNRTLILGRVGEHPNFWGNLREPKFGQVIGQENARFWSSRQSRPLSRQLLIAVKAVFSC